MPFVELPSNMIVVDAIRAVLILELPRRLIVINANRAVPVPILELPIRLIVIDANRAVLILELWYIYFIIDNEFKIKLFNLLD